MRCGRLGEAGSINWKWPGATSNMGPRTVQVDTGNDGLVAASIVRLAPGIFVSVIWTAPSVALMQAARQMGFEAHWTSSAPISTCEPDFRGRPRWSVARP